MLMIQGGDQKAGGFTLVETLIVLAVTGALFVSAALLINGKQNTTQFQTAINNLQQQIQQIINETASGYYPNKGNFTCSGASSPITFTAVGSGQGTNSGCIFLGKVIQFGSASDNSELITIPIAGNQFVAGSPTQTLAAAAPRAIAPASAIESVPDTSLTTKMENGLSVASSNGAFASSGMYYDKVSGGSVATGIVGFLAGSSSGDITGADASGNLKSGAQQLSLYGVKTSTSNESVTAAANAIGNNTVTAASNLEAASSVFICLASATTNQSGLITIGGGGSLAVTLTIKDGTTC
jgi:type II secretory pathway pseudopilin PulG